MDGELHFEAMGRLKEERVVRVDMQPLLEPPQPPLMILLPQPQPHQPMILAHSVVDGLSPVAAQTNWYYYCIHPYSF